MNCVKAKDVLGMYLDGELRQRHRCAVQEHLEACESCRGELTSLSSVSARLSSLPVCEPGEAFYRRLFQRVWEQREPARPGARYVWGAALAATAMLALFLTLRPPLEPVEQVTRPAVNAPQVTEAPSQPPARLSAAAQSTQVPSASEPQASAVRPSAAPKPLTQPRRLRVARGPFTARAPQRPSAEESPSPTPEQVAAVSEALARLTTAAQETGDALHRAVVLQAKRQETARETLETAFSAFAVSPVTTGEVPETHEL